jgi:hypothetical protein
LQGLIARCKNLEDRLQLQAIADTLQYVGLHKLKAEAEKESAASTKGEE